MVLSSKLWGVLGWSCQSGRRTDGLGRAAVWLGPRKAILKSLPAWNENVRYLPADLIGWSQAIAVCKPNANKWPSLHLHSWDIVFVLGVLEHLRKPTEVLSHLARSCLEIMISYNATGMCDANRDAFGWVNSFTGPSFLRLLQECGYHTGSSTALIVKTRSTAELPWSCLAAPSGTAAAWDQRVVSAMRASVLNRLWNWCRYLGVGLTASLGSRCD